MTHGSRVVYPSKAKPPRVASKRFWVTVGCASAAALSAVVFWYVARLPVLAVHEIHVDGRGLFAPAEVEEAVRSELAGRRWGVFPANNFFAVSAGRLEGALRTRFPQAADVRVEKGFPDKVTVNVFGYTLWGIYCEASAVRPEPTGCFYLDRRGTAYEALSHFSGWLVPVIYGERPATLGAAVLPEATVDFFINADQALTTLGGRIIALSLSSTTPDDARLILAEGWQVWVTPSRPASEWSAVLRTVLAGDIGEKRSNLAYVDLRFGNKVFYKFK